MTRRKQIHNSIYLGASILICLTLPFSIKWCSIAIIILTCNWIIEGDFRKKIKRLRERSFVWAFLGFYVLYLIGLLYAENDQWLFNIEQKLALFILPLIYGSSRIFLKKELKLILFSFAVSCFFAVAVSLFLTMNREVPLDPVMLNFDFFNADRYKDLYADAPEIWNYISYAALGSALYLHPTYFSLYIVFTMAILFYLISDQYEGYHVFVKVIIHLIFLLFIGILVLLSSRIILASFILLCLFFSYFSYFRNRRYQGLAYGFTIIGLLLFLVYSNPISRYRFFEEPLRTKFSYADTATDWNSLNLRILEWKSSLTVIKKNPFFGAGTGESKSELNKEYAKVNLGIFDISYNPHNQFLQTAIEIGIVGTLVFIIILVYPAYRAYHQKSGIYLVFLFLVIMACLTESILERQKGVIFYSFFNSILFFQLYKGGSDE